MCGTVPTSPRFRSASEALGSISALLATPFLSARALMNDSPVPIIPFAGDFIASDDERLFAFIESLRKSVSEKVKAGQGRGMSLSEIVAEVREMVRFADDDPDLPRPFPANASKAISRQAVAWCIEAYQPLVFTGGTELITEPAAQTQLPIN
jgi:hypothetical protein